MAYREKRRKCFNKTYTKDDLGDLEPRFSESGVGISEEAFEGVIV